MDYVLGVDGGATRTLIQIADTNEKKLSRSFPDRVIIKILV